MKPEKKYAVWLTVRQMRVVSDLCKQRSSDIKNVVSNPLPYTQARCGNAEREQLYGDIIGSLDRRTDYLTKVEAERTANIDGGGVR